MNKVKLFNENLEIGGYILPTDFVCINESLIKNAQNLDFFDAYKLIYEYISESKLPADAFANLSGVEMPLSIVNFDENLSAVEMFDGKNAVYTDYIVDNSSIFTKICSLVTVFILCYIDMVNLEIINANEKVNFSLPSCDFLIPLSLYVAKKCGLPINKILLGSTGYDSNIVKDFFLSTITEEDENDAISIFFEEEGYLFDPISIRGLIAQEDYYSDYEDNKTTVVLSLISPYLFARRIYKILTYKNELNIQKAINGIYNETAMEIPESLNSGDIEPFYKEPCDNELKDLLNLIKSSNKV